MADDDTVDAALTPVRAPVALSVARVCNSVAQRWIAAMFHPRSRPWSGLTWRQCRRENAERHDRCQCVRATRVS